MPVSKKRKKKQRYSPPPPKSKVAPKKKVSTRQILIYVISGLMILSLAVGFLASNTSSSRNPTAVPESNNILLATPAPDDQAEPAAEETAESDPAPEPTSEN